MKFDIVAKEKFERGQKEHGDWDKIDPIAELKCELIDLYWYSSHRRFPKVLGLYIRLVARLLWVWLS